MKILLISPPYERLKGLTVESVPIGLLYLATTLKENNYISKVFDADTSFKTNDAQYSNLNRASSQLNYSKNLNNESHPAWTDVVEVLNDFKPDIVGVSIMTPLFSSAKKTIQLVKKTLPNTFILGGGPHLTILKEKAMESMPEIDVGFVGEAEESIIDFIKNINTPQYWNNIPGLLLKNNNCFVYTGRRNRIEQLDNLPIPDRSLLINHQKYQRSKMGLMIASRGCPYQCAFCASVPLWERKVKIRSPESLVKEIDYLVKKYAISSFGFWDDTFTINKNAVVSFCQKIHKQYGAFKFKWNCLSNINTLDDNILKWLKKAGCKTIQIGVESGSDRILKLIKKGITTNQVRETCRSIRKKGFWLHTFFMIGIPYETEEDIKKTFDLIKDIKPDSVNLCTFTPHPGTELFNYSLEKGLIENPYDYTMYDEIGHHSTDNFFSDQISKEKYQELLKEILTLTTKITGSMSFRKLTLSLKRMTFSRFIFITRKTIYKFMSKKHGKKK